MDRSIIAIDCLPLSSLTSFGLRPNTPPQRRPAVFISYGQQTKAAGESTGKKANQNQRQRMCVCFVVVLLHHYLVKADEAKRCRLFSCRRSAKEVKSRVRPGRERGKTGCDKTRSESSLNILPARVTVFSFWAALFLPLSPCASCTVARGRVFLLRQALSGRRDLFSRSSCAIHPPLFS